MFGIDDMAIATIGSGLMSSLGSVGSSLLSSSNSSVKYRDLKKQYKFNSQLQKEQYNYNAELAAAERCWQTRMSNTAYQRARADLEKAGFNPLLSLINGGASSGSGAAGSVGLASVGSPTSSRSHDMSGISRAFDSVGNTIKAFATESLKTDLAQRKADVAKTEADTQKTLKESESIAPEARKVHDFISTGKDIATPIASAYGAKKGVEVATKVMKAAGVRNAASVARQAVPSVASKGINSAFGVVGKYFAPLIGYEGGKYGEDVSRKRFDSQHNKSWSTILSKKPLLH